MSENITNIAQACQRIGTLEGELTQAQEARTAATTDLETAKAAHAKEIESLKASHSADIERLKVEHSAEVERFTSEASAQAQKITSLLGEVESLKSNAQSASAQAANIVAQAGGEPVGSDDGNGQPGDAAKPKDELWAEYNAIEGIDEKRAFYLENIKGK